MVKVHTYVRTYIILPMYVVHICAYCNKYIIYGKISKLKYCCVFVGTYHTVLGPVEADPEYQLIVESNNMLVELDTEISMLVLNM